MTIRPTDAFYMGQNITKPCLSGPIKHLVDLKKWELTTKHKEPSLTVILVASASRPRNCLPAALGVCVCVIFTLNKVAQYIQYIIIQLLSLDLFWTSHHPHQLHRHQKDTAIQGSIDPPHPAPAPPDSEKRVRCAVPPRTFAPPGCAVPSRRRWCSSRSCRTLIWGKPFFQGQRWVTIAKSGIAPTYILHHVNLVLEMWRYVKGWLKLPVRHCFHEIARECWKVKNYSSMCHQSTNPPPPPPPPPSPPPPPLIDLPGWSYLTNTASASFISRSSHPKPKSEHI